MLLFLLLLTKIYMITTPYVQSSQIAISGAISTIDMKTNGYEWWKTTPYKQELKTPVDPQNWFPAIDLNFDKYNTIYNLIGINMSFYSNTTTPLLYINLCGIKSEPFHIYDTPQDNTHLLITWLLTMHNKFTCYNTASTKLGFCIAINYNSYAMWIQLEHITASNKALYQSENNVWGIGIGPYIHYDGDTKIQFNILTYYDTGLVATRFKRMNDKTTWILPSVISIPCIAYVYISSILDIMIPYKPLCDHIIISFSVKVYLPQDWICKDAQKYITDNILWKTIYNQFSIYIGVLYEI